MIKTDSQGFELLPCSHCEAWEEESDTFNFISIAETSPDNMREKNIKYLVCPSCRWKLYFENYFIDFALEVFDYNPIVRKQLLKVKALEQDITVDVVEALLSQIDGYSMEEIYPERTELRKRVAEVRRLAKVI